MDKEQFVADAMKARELAKVMEPHITAANNAYLDACEKAGLNAIAASAVLIDIYSEVSTGMSDSLKVLVKRLNSGDKLEDIVSDIAAEKSAAGEE